MTAPRLALPERDAAAEDTFLEALAEQGLDELVGLVVALVEEGRPGLAARVSSLLPEDGELDEIPAVARARRAARLLLMAAPDRRGPIVAELEELVEELKQAHVARARGRMRRTIKDPHNPREERRKPRGTGRR